MSESRIFINVERFTEKDVWGDNLVESHGFPGTFTYGQMHDLAIANNCNLIIKSGEKGKWYLKNKPFERTREGLRADKYGRAKHVTYLIEYEETDDNGEATVET
uniref:Uncharacterized protein n=1 Tax=viral metagenome TaxID=1070528 RepID=A0A6C0JJ30_9ZZZZ